MRNSRKLQNLFEPPVRNQRIWSKRSPRLTARLSTICSSCLHNGWSNTGIIYLTCSISAPKPFRQACVFLLKQVHQLRWKSSRKFGAVRCFKASSFHDLSTAPFKHKLVELLREILVLFLEDPVIRERPSVVRAVGRCLQH